MPAYCHRPRQRRPRPARNRPPHRNGPAPAGLARTATTASTTFLLAPAGRTALVYAGATLLLLLALTAAYAPRAIHRTAARRTLRLLLRLAPWYSERP
ncbi:hypothetical protein [Streptomyces sp. NPDC059928]|uniref:hypothetical protein n=1 Tax=unclassified Streptomyces TaxID=2593676 RepID=UPI003668E5B2